MDNNNTTITEEYYKPKNKQERDARRRIYDRYRDMRDDTLRKQAEKDWDEADKAFIQWMPEREYGDWRAHVVLPDAFAAVQQHMQETVDRKSRPVIQLSEEADMAREMWANAIMTNSMDRTGFDYQQYLAKQCAAIRGTAYVMEYYRVDKRDIQDPTGVNPDGTLKYTKKEIIDFDDTYTEHKDNQYIFVDPGASHIDVARDMVEREVLDWKEFQRIYLKKSDFMNVKKVTKAGIISDQVKFFQMPHDMDDDDVEILHYYNRATDSYDVLANNVLVRIGPIPFKHKELPLAVHTHYNVPGMMYGIGIPKVIFSLMEERKSLRNLALDRQHMQVNKMFLVNDLIDLDDEDVRTRPNGFIPVNTNGLQLSQVIQPLEYGDIPPSYYQAENLLLQDIRKAHGIQDQLEAASQGGTATEAAIQQQTSQKRIQLINTLAEMDTILRIGKLKWSNIQFFYPAPRVQTITEGDEAKNKKTYRKVKVSGQQFEVVTENGKKKLRVDDIDGASGFTLDKKMARFMDGDWEVTVGADAGATLSKPLRQAKITEMFNTITMNPQLTAAIDPKRSVKRFLEINDEDPKLWMRDAGMTDTDWERLAAHENMVMSSGQALAPTENAPTAHTKEHLNFVDSPAYEALSDGIKAIFMEHITGEHENNPDTGAVADIMQPQPTPEGEPEIAVPGGSATPQPNAGPVEVPAADITPSTIGGADQQDTRKQQIASPV